MSEGIWWFGYAVVAGFGLLGVRLLRGALGARSLPEALMGVFFVACGPLGYLPYLFPDGPHLAALSAPELAPVLRAVGGAGILVASIALCVFTWRVFRADEGWAAGLAAGCCVLMVGGWLSLGLAGGFDTKAALRTDYVLAMTARVVAFVWATCEPLLYYTAARRRVRLGLADPVLTNRFLLWSIWSGTSLLVLATVLVQGFLDVTLGPDPGRQLEVVTILVAAAIPNGIAMWLTFFPPPAYRSWLVARATAAARPTLPASALAE